MNKVKKTLKRLWQDESGQGATEYIVLLVVISLIVITFKDHILRIVGEKTGDMGKRLGEAISMQK